MDENNIAKPVSEEQSNASAQKEELVPSGMGVPAIAISGEDLAALRNRGWMDLSVSIILSVLISMVAIVAYNRFYAPKLYTVDLTIMIEDRAKGYAQTGLTAVQVQDDMSKYLNILKLATDNAAARHKGMVVVAQAVISGSAGDLTEEVKASVEKIVPPPKQAQASSPEISAGKSQISSGEASGQIESIVDELSRGVK